MCIEYILIHLYQALGIIKWMKLDIERLKLILLEPICTKLMDAS